MANTPQIRIIELPLQTTLPAPATSLTIYLPMEDATVGAFRMSLENFANAFLKPSTSTDKAIARFNGIKGQIQNSVATCDDSGVITASGLRATSSIRYKSDIKKLDNALEKLKLFEGVTYFNNITKEQDMGLIAEDVYNHTPELVGMNDTGTPESVNYNGAISILINAVNELHQEVLRLKARG